MGGPAFADLDRSGPGQVEGAGLAPQGLDGERLALAPGCVTRGQAHPSLNLRYLLRSVNTEQAEVAPGGCAWQVLRRPQPFSLGWTQLLNLAACHSEFS